MNTANDSKVRMGIDLGGTKIELAVLDELHNVLLRKRIPTEADHGPEHIIAQIKQLYFDARKAYPRHSLGIGTPGSISAQSGLLRNSNTVCLNGLPLQSLLEHALGCSLKAHGSALRRS